MTEAHEDWDERFWGSFRAALRTRCLDCVTKEMPGMMRLWLQMLREGPHGPTGVQGNENCASCGKSRLRALRKEGL